MDIVGSGRTSIVERELVAGEHPFPLLEPIT
jgi:hypothetical protein